MKICGGFYGEFMLHPEHAASFGSGVRAAAAVAALCTEVELFTWSAISQIDELHAICNAYGIKVHRHDRKHAIDFSYVHGCVPPTLIPDLRNIEQTDPMRVTGDVIVRFGMLEGTAVVDAKWAVFDPQSEVNPEAFHVNGSRARHLAVVLNASEAIAMSGKGDPRTAAAELLKADGAEVVVVKCGLRGALVATPKKQEWVAAYKTPSVFPLGSGDVFTAAFAYHWAVKRKSPTRAAQLASLATAHYCANRYLPLPVDYEREAKKRYPPVRARTKYETVYLAGPFFSLGERWLIEQLRNALLESGLKVFSPLHDVGHGEATHVGPADLRGLDKAGVVLACMDGMDSGTVFEVGYARSQGITVIALSTKSVAEDLTMIVGSGCVVVHDIPSAVYRAGWIAAEGAA
jgi:nucleoside 2-deoxyribosyltransferase